MKERERGTVESLTVCVAMHFVEKKGIHLRFYMSEAS